MRKIFFVVITALLSIAIIASCNLEGTETEGVTLGGTGNPGAARLSTARSVGTAGSVEVTDGEHTLIINKVEMVFFEINLGVADSMDSEDLEAGPIVMELPLDGSITPIFQAVDVAPGQYKDLEIEVKIPDGHERESEFVDTYPEWDIEVSIRVEGTFDGNPFTYTQDFNDDFELEFDPPLDINGGIGLVLAIDVGTWFWNDTKTTLYNPNDIEKDSSEESQVEDNIEDSFEAFEDSQELD